MHDISVDWNFVLSVVAVIVAVIALFQTNRQIKLSNKQNLFNSRVEIFLVASGMIELYKRNRSDIDKRAERAKNNPFYDVDAVAAFLTNNTYLVQLDTALAFPHRSEEHNIFFTKMESLKEVAAKIRFLFTGKASDLLSDYVLSYQELLSEMYFYKSTCVRIENYCREKGVTPVMAAKEFYEKKHRDELVKSLFKLRENYDNLVKNDVESIIKKQIKL